MELLRHASEICYVSGYERGTVECLNMIIRSCCNSNDLNIARSVYNLLCIVFI